MSILAIARDVPQQAERIGEVDLDLGDVDRRAPVRCGEGGAIGGGGPGQQIMAIGRILGGFAFAKRQAAASPRLTLVAANSAGERSGVCPSSADWKASTACLSWSR